MEKINNEVVLIDEYEDFFKADSTQKINYVKGPKKREVYIGLDTQLDVGENSLNLPTTIFIDKDKSIYLRFFLGNGNFVIKQIKKNNKEYLEYRRILEEQN